MSARAAMTMTVSQSSNCSEQGSCSDGLGRGGGHGERVPEKRNRFPEPVQSLFAGFNATLWASASPPDLLQAMLGAQQRRQAYERWTAFQAVPSSRQALAAPKDFEQVLNVDAPRMLCNPKAGRGRVV